MHNITDMTDMDMAELADHDIRSKSRKTNPQKAISEQVDIVSSVHEV